MRRILLKIEYDGSNFVGWQYQANGRSVQGAIEEAIASAFDEHPRVLGAGRTDSGVHALGQAAHVDLLHPIPVDDLPKSLNMRLPDDVRIVSARIVAENFNARRDARLKNYCYYFDDCETRPVMTGLWTHWTRHHLDAERMHRACRAWLGEHDFSSFRASTCGADSPVRSIDDIRVERLSLADPFPIEVVRFSVSGRSFLQHQVRAMAGTLVEIGRGARDAEWAGVVLTARDRSAAGPTLPPHGLVLVGVEY